MRRFFPILIMVALGACTKQETSSPDPLPNTAPSVSSSVPASSSAPAPVTSTESAVAPEVNPPGDIPDSQAFVTFASKAGGYSLEVPEGWARSENGAETTFVDKLDGVRVTVTPAGAAATAASAQQNEAKKIERAGRAVQITAVKDITLPGGPAVVISYSSNSDPNPVTNRQVRQENQTYLYFRNGREAMLTLWAPKGADNADQWNRMSKSFRWQ